jgi:outer membrane protein assembly factor BamD
VPGDTVIRQRIPESMQTTTHIKRPKIRVVASLCAVLAVGSLASACASGRDLRAEGVEDTARLAYYQAMVELVDGNYIEATNLFQKVARSPRYVRYAALSKLRIADALFVQDRNAEAAEVYRGFLSQYKGDPNVPYARYRLAASFYNRIPSDWFLAPPAHENDQTLTRQAEAELKGFLSAFPTSRFAPDARVMLGQARRMLFEQELYAANFYEGREKWRAVAWRLDTAIEVYPEFAMTDPLVWRMASAYARIENDGQAARAYGMYLKNFPDGVHKVEAKRRMESIRTTLEATP